MRCSGCGADNKPERRFCSACGAALPRPCPDCAFVNDPGDEFCGGCGKPLVQPSRAAGEPAASYRAVERHGWPDAERRQLTVMFCDLVGSTGLAARMDPEELRDLVHAYQEASATVIEHYEGCVAQYLGDGLLVYFGYPTAHEDDAQRAVRAGLGVLAAVRKVNAELAATLGQLLSVRIGIHTGLVVIGEVGGGRRLERLALGETPNVAACVQKLARPDSVALSATTHRLVQRFFLCTGPTEHAVSGLASTLAIYQVEKETGPRRRIERSAGGVSELLARDQELALLLDRWHQVEEVGGRVVLVAGEAGIGKSRLVQAFLQSLPEQGPARLELQCSAYYANSPLFPVTELLPGLLELAAEDSAEQRLARLEEFCARRRLSVDEGLPLLASLLSIPAAHRYPLPPMSPERQKQRTLEVLLGIVLALAAESSVVMVGEDLHWIDPTTLELLTLLLAQAPSARLFVLLTARLTFKPPWRPHSHITPLTLNRYTRRQASLMVERLTGGKRLPGEVVEQIVGKTDGVPLFIEELTKMVLESGLLVSREDSYQLTGPLPPLAIPSTLQDSLTARLDLLGTAKPVAQVCAAIGRAVPHALLHVLLPIGEAALEQELSRLVDAELLNQRGVAPDVVYVFKHVLLQEAAYQSLLKSVRAQYHERIALAMVERFSSEAQLHPEFVAAHFTEAGNAREAIRWWQLAGQQAVQRAAYAEAIAHYRRALAVVASLPASRQRDDAELGLRVALGYASIPVHGWAAAETAQAFTRAGELCDESGEAPELFRALWGLGAFHFVRGDQRQARTVADQCLDVARRAGDVDALIEAHYLGGIVSSVQGAFTSARDGLEQSLELYGPHKRALHTAQYGQDPKASALGWLAMDLWALGFPDSGLRCAREALAFVEQGTHPFTLARALAGVGFVHVYRRDPQPGHSKLAAAIALCVEQNFTYFRAVVSSFEGSNQVLLGNTQDGIALMRQSVAELRAIGSELLFTVIFGHLASAHLASGQVAEGLAAVNEGLALVERNEEHWGEAELHRLRGELLLQRTPEDWEPAQACFERAIELSTQHRARSYELRAAMSLARLWQRRGRHADALGCLSACYAGFSEGLDTPDLLEATSLLQQLS